MSDHDKPYHRFAKIYDEMGMNHFSEKMVAYTFQLLKKSKHKPKSVLDLCCGTGTAAMMFAEKGFETVGLDGSEYMLKMARKKTKYRKLQINYYHQHLPKIDIIKNNRIQKFDLITSYYDSLNYLLTERDLTRCFKNIHRHLNPGGMLIFDMNMYSAFKNIWVRTRAGCHKDIAWIFETKLNDKRHQAELSATFFIRKKRLWEKFTEIHNERAYTITTLRKILNASGLKPLGIYKCFTSAKPDQKTNRIAVVSVRKD